MAEQQVVFQALYIVNEHRTAYGLRYNDLQRYRKHCANRTHRLRSNLNITHGKGRDFKKLPAFQTETLKDGHLQLLLFEAERAWAYSQELIAASLEPANSDKAGTLRHSATGRFRRAVHWATQLLSHCQALYNASRLSADNLIQASVYLLILNGRFLRYRDEFEDALAQLSVSRNLLDELASTAITSRDQALAILFADEVGPEIRYCAHELGNAKAYDVDGIVADVGPKSRDSLVDGCSSLLQKLHDERTVKGKGESRKQLKELAWEGQPVQIRNPELVDVLLRVQEAEKRLDGRRDGQVQGQSKQGKTSKKGIAAYDAVLSALSDAADLAKKLADSRSSSVSSSKTTGSRDGHFIHAYIVYQLLARRIQRDLLLVESILSESMKNTPKSSSSSKGTPSQDPRVYPGLVKLLDTIIQSLTQMRTLSIVDDSPDLASAIDARISYTKARRCLYLARCYAASQVKKYAQALVLVQHANIHNREGRTSLSLVTDDPVNVATSTPAFYPLQLQGLEDLDQTLASEALSFKVDWFTYNGGSINLEDHEKYKKPTFFNIALNYVDLDLDKLNEKAGKQVEPSAAPVRAKPQEKKLDEENTEQVEQEEAKADGRPSRLGSLLGGWWGRS